jgi:uncharacterized protein
MGPETLVVVIAAVVFMAGVVTGATALGFAQITATALALLVDPRAAVIILAITVPVVSGLQVFHHRRDALPAKRLVPLLVGALVGVPIGVWLLTVLSGAAVAGVVGAVTLLYVLTRMIHLRPNVTRDQEPYLGPVAGAGAGVLNGIIGVSGPVLIPYLLALGLPAATFGYAVSVMFVCMTVLRLVGLVATGTLVPSTALLGAALLVPALGGQRVGFVLQRRLDAPAFERLVLATLVVGGISLVARALGF